MLNALLVLFCGCVVYVFGFVMGIICASRKRRNRPKEPCETLEDVINREG